MEQVALLGKMKVERVFGRERNIIFLVAFLLLLDLALSVGYPTVTAFFAKPVSLSMSVVLGPNGEVVMEPQEVVVPPPAADVVFWAKLDDFVHLYLPFTMAGLFLIPSFLLGTLYWPHSYLWICAAIAAIFFVRYSKGIAVWKRVIYTYLLIVLIAGMGAQLWISID